MRRLALNRPDHRQLRLGDRVPEADTRLGPGRGEQPRAGTEGARADGSVLQQLAHVLGRLDVLELDRAVRSGAGDEASVRAELAGEDGPAVARQHAVGPLLRELDEGDGAVRARDRDHAVRPGRAVVQRTVVALGRDLAPRRDVPDPQEPVLADGDQHPAVEGERAAPERPRVGPHDPTLGSRRRIPETGGPVDADRCHEPPIRAPGAARDGVRSLEDVPRRLRDDR